MDLSPRGASGGRDGTTTTAVRPHRRHWLGVGAGTLAVVALTLTAHGTSSPHEAAAGAGRIVTYEISGLATATTVVYGDIFDRIFSPYAATSVDTASLPWRLSVPYTEPLSMHDLTARSVDGSPAALTCVVRLDDTVVSTATALGEVGCDTTPAEVGPASR